MSTKIYSNDWSPLDQRLKAFAEEQKGLGCGFMLTLSSPRGQEMQFAPATLLQMIRGRDADAVKLMNLRHILREILS